MNALSSEVHVPTGHTQSLRHLAASCVPVQRISTRFSSVMSRLCLRRMGNDDVTLTTSGADSDYFLIGTAELQYGALAPPSVSTPEPASLMMLGSALAALVWKLRRRNRA